MIERGGGGAFLHMQLADHGQLWCVQVMEMPTEKTAKDTGGGAMIEQVRNGQPGITDKLAR